MVAGRRPGFFERRMALQTIIVSDIWPATGGQTSSGGKWLYKRCFFADVWSSTSGQTPSNGKWLYKLSFEGRLVGDRRPDAFERQMALQIITFAGRTAISFRSDDFCGRLAADRRPDVFEWQNVVQIMIRGALGRRQAARPL